jgi:hypothetical protein
LTFLVVNTSPAPPFNAPSKLTDCFSSFRPSESANCNTLLDTVGLSRLPNQHTFHVYAGARGEGDTDSCPLDGRWISVPPNSIISQIPQLTHREAVSEPSRDAVSWQLPVVQTLFSERRFGGVPRRSQGRSGASPC